MLVAAVAASDYTPTSVRWPGFEASSSEDLIGDQRITTYPIANMFDGDPRTAWVFKRNPPSEGGLDMKDYWGGRYAVSIQFRNEAAGGDQHSRIIDGLEIMNGYNKSEPVFRRNNRIVEMAIYEGSSAYDAEPLKVVRLSDKMGWHRISLPRKAYTGLVLTFTGVRKGRDDDVCVSELRLMSHGKPISMKVSKAFLATTGSECG